MKNMRKIAIIAMIIIAAGALAYFGIQRYQNHHGNNVKIQAAVISCASCPKSGCPNGYTCVTGQCYNKCCPQYCNPAGGAVPG